MDQIKPKGILIPIGGHEDKNGDMAILTRVIDETRRSNPRIEVITIATSVPEEISKDYFAAFEDLGLEDVGEIYIDKREENGDYVDRIKDCDAVFFSGGNQLKLTTRLGGTELLSILKERYILDRDFVIAGTSAGAAAMSSTMIVSGSGVDALIKGQLQLTNGLDFIDTAFIDTHFTQRGRFGRLIQTVTANPAILGLGFGEDTGAVIYNGDEMEIIGSGLAVVVDGMGMKYTNITDIADGQPITVEGIKTHILGSGQIFSLSERRLLKSEK
jgi:cyanophycinase